MALDRTNLRDDLVAVIGAGRELSPEHDYALADVFLRLAHERLNSELTPPSSQFDGRNRVAALAGAMCLAVAALLSPFLLFHGDDGRGNFNQSGALPQPVQPYHHFDHSNWWDGR